MNREMNKPAWKSVTDYYIGKMYWTTSTIKVYVHVCNWRMVLKGRREQSDFIYIHVCVFQDSFFQCHLKGYSGVHDDFNLSTTIHDWVTMK